MTLRLVYDADAPAPPPRRPAVALSSAEGLEPLLHGLLRERRNGELLLRGAGTARLCLFEGKIAWVRLDAHPEHLGDVMRRELGLTEASLRQAIAHCQTTGLRFGEGLVALELVRPHELRCCLLHHMADQLWELLAWPGPITVEHSLWPHRYDHAYTFTLDQLLARPSAPSKAERDHLAALVQRCRQRLPELELVCVIEANEGTVLHPLCGPQRAAEDLLCLCTAGLRRLVANRVTHTDGAPEGMVLAGNNGCLVVQELPWHPGWLLVLAGRERPGRMLAVASTASDERKNEESP